MNKYLDMKLFQIIVVRELSLKDIYDSELEIESNSKGQEYTA